MLNDVLLSGVISFAIVFIVSLPIIRNEEVTISEAAFYSFFAGLVTIISTLLVLSQYVNG